MIVVYASRRSLCEYKRYLGKCFDARLFMLWLPNATTSPSTKTTILSQNRKKEELRETRQDQKWFEQVKQARVMVKMYITETETPRITDPKTLQ